MVCSFLLHPGQVGDAGVGCRCNLGNIMHPTPFKGYQTSNLGLVGERECAGWGRRGGEMLRSAPGGEERGEGKGKGGRYLGF